MTPAGLISIIVIPLAIMGALVLLALVGRKSEEREQSEQDRERIEAQARNVIANVKKHRLENQ